MWMSGLADRFLDALEKNDEADKESKCETDNDGIEEEVILMSRKYSCVYCMLFVILFES